MTRILLVLLGALALAIGAALAQDKPATPADKKPAGK